MMYLKDRSFRFIYDFPNETPSTGSDTDASDFERWSGASAEVINLPAERIRNAAVRIRWGNTGQEMLLNDCLTAALDEDNPLMSYEGTEDLIAFVRDLITENGDEAGSRAGLAVLNEADLNAMLEAMAVRHRIDGRTGLPTADQERHIEAYVDMLEYLRDVPEAIEEAEGEIADLDSARLAAYNFGTNIRDNLRGMSSGRANALAGGLAMATIWIFTNKKNPIAQALRDDIIGLVTVAGIAITADGVLELASGQGAIEWLEEFNRRSGDAMAGYFEMPYETDEQKERMDAVNAIISGEHSELFGDNVTFAHLFDAYPDNMESIVRNSEGPFSGPSGATLLADAMAIILEKFGPDGQGTLYVNETTRQVFDYATDPQSGVRPQEALIDLIFSDPDAPRRLMTTFTDDVVDTATNVASDVGAYVGDVGGDVAAVANYHVVRPTVNFAQESIAPVLDDVVDYYHTGRDWLDMYSDYVRTQLSRENYLRMPDDYDGSTDFFADLELNDAEPPFADSLQRNVMHLGLLPDAALFEPVPIPFIDETVSLDIPLSLQTAFVVRTEEGKRYLVTDSRMFNDGFGEMRLALRSDENPRGWDLTDNDAYTFEEYRTTIIEIPDDLDLGVQGFELASNPPNSNSPLWRISDNNMRSRNVDATRYGGNPDIFQQIINDNMSEIGENWFAIPDTAENGAVILDANGRVVGLNAFNFTRNNNRVGSIGIDSILINRMINTIENPSE